MENSKHTEGNWTFKPSGDANFYFLKVESKNTWLMNIQQNGQLLNDEQIANVKLITASPDLLKSMIELKKSMDETIKCQNGGLKHLSQAEQDRYKIICDSINNATK